MTDNEIIKANELCNGINGDKCDECAYLKLNTANSDCVVLLAKDTIALINRQKAEIERLKGWQDLLKAEKHSLIKAEAIKEFAERLKGEVDDPVLIEGKYIDRAIDIIDKLVKEITEQRKEDGKNG